MTYYNNDGSWETFCLNGTICCSLILEEEPPSRYNYIKTESTLYAIKVLKKDRITLCLENIFSTIPTLLLRPSELLMINLA